MKKLFIFTLLACSIGSAKSKTRKECIDLILHIHSPDTKIKRGDFMDKGEYIKTVVLQDGTEVIFVAQVGIKMSVLELNKITIFNDRKLFGHVPAGIEVLAASLREIKKDAKNAGFELLILSGERLTGKSPNHYFRKAIKL